MSKFGRHLRPLWHLDADGIFLNHGSFGACPIEVLAAQSRWRETMERQPDRFFRHAVSPLNPTNMLRQAADRLAGFMGTAGSRVAFVPNPTEAVNTVLSALTLKSGDEILVLDCVYNAVRLGVEEKCRRSGARMVTVSLPLPLQANDVVGRIADAAGPNTRLAIVDHIASATAIVFPVAEIVKALQARGVKVLIDGAHALGQLDLDLEAIGADWYTATAHKWFYSPKGSAFLWARNPDDVRLRPLSVSHYYDDPFPLCFDYADKCPVWELHRIYSDAPTQAWVQEGCRTAGIGCLDCKKKLTDRVVAEISIIRQRAGQYEEDPALVRKIVAEGCEKARVLARQTLEEVHEAIGMNYR